MAAVSRVEVPWRSGKVLVFLALFGMPISELNAKSCPEAPPVRETYSEQATVTAIGALRGVVAGRSSNIVRRRQNEVLSRYPRADQLVVNLTTIWMVCRSLAADPSITEADFRDELRQLRSDIFRSDVRMVPVYQPPVLARYATAERRPPTPDTSGRGVSGGALGWATRYINNPPTVVTSENRYFVIVSSPTGRREAEVELARHQARYPDVAFAMYPPYRGNPHYAVMLATWVSERQAGSVRRTALELGMDQGSFIWRCPGDGNSC